MMTDTLTDIGIQNTSYVAILLFSMFQIHLYHNWYPHIDFDGKSSS